MAPTHEPELDRYSRQTLFEPIGVAGQRRLADARVTLIGCGALGTVAAQTLVRAGVGFLRICDRDYIEPDNLQRQVLFDEKDIADNLPKAQAAARKLATINSTVTVEPVVRDVNHRNIAAIIEQADLILDGTDNFETRYLINDIAISADVPWIYAAVIGGTGLVMPVLAGQTPCLRCVFESAPPAELSPTCDTAGVIGPAVNVVASLQSAEAIKILIGDQNALCRGLLSIDVWSQRFVRLNVGERRADCPCCGHRRFDYLSGRLAGQTTALCGRDAVQVLPAARTEAIDLDAVAQKLSAVADGKVDRSPFMIKARVGDYTLSVFPDGRAIIKGTQLPEEARSVYARFVGA